jgi:hypothetical protein
MHKDIVMKETLKFLQKKPETNFMELKENLEQIFWEKGKLQAYKGDSRIPDGIIKKNAQLIRLLEEVKWDLIMQRVLTPGEETSFVTPELRVSNMDNLVDMLKRFE